MTDDGMKSAFEWEAELDKITDSFIWDPDGFRLSDGVRMDTPVTYGAYQQRKMMCTIGPYRRGMWNSRYDE